MIRLPFSWGELLVGLLIMAAIAVCVFLIIALAGAVKTFKKLNALLKKNGPAVDKTIANIQSITDDVNQVTSNLGALAETITEPEGPAGVVASVVGTVVHVIQCVREMGNK